ECDQNGTNCKILYTKSNNAGIAFTTSVALSSPQSSLPDIKAFENKVYIVYGQSYPVQGVNVRDVFLLKSTDGGDNFESPVNLSISLATGSTNPASTNPNIDVS